MYDLDTWSRIFNSLRLRILEEYDYEEDKDLYSESTSIDEKENGTGSDNI